MTDKKQTNMNIELIAGIGGIALLSAALVVYLIDPLMLNLTYTLLGTGAVAMIFVLIQMRLKIAEAVRSGGTRYTINMLVLSLVVLAILVAVNFIAHKNTYRLDMTEEGLHTLSDQTLKTLKGITEDEVTITAFFSQNNPEEIGIRNKLKELFDNFAYVNDRIKHKFIDPDKDPIAVKTFNIQAAGPRIVITYKGKEERVKGFEEQDLINGIVRVSRQEQKELYFLTGHGEASLEDPSARGYTELQKRLESEGYKTANLSLLEKGAMPSNASALVIAGPEKPLLEVEEKIIQEYLNKGGKVLYMIEPFTPVSLNKMLLDYGIVPHNTIVVDTTSRVFGMGPNVPLGQSYATNHAITQNFRFATFFPTSRSLSHSKGEEGVIVVPLIQTSPNAWGETQFQNVDEAGQTEVQFDEDDIAGPITLAIASNKLNIQGEDKISGEARLVVFGDRDFASNQFLPVSGNGDFILNVIAWLAEEEDLISIRPKVRKASRVFLTQRQANFLTMFSQWVIPIFVLMAGIGIWVIRRRK